jgi:hypothetical protein
MRLDADEMLAAAVSATGLADWGDFDVEGPFRVLVRALNEEAGLHPRGREAAHARLSTALANRLRTVTHLARRPSATVASVTRPIFIPGLPRSGTTLLLNLLSCDVTMRSLHMWECMQPVPPVPAGSGEAERRVAAVEAALELQGFLEPEVRAIHPFGARLAEECIFLCEQIMTYTPYAAFWNVPSYAALGASADYTAVFAFHKSMLQVLQGERAGARWVLKAPTHMLHIREILSVYPDAVFIQTHRDPAQVIPSLAKLFVVLRRLFSDRAGNFGLAEAARANLSTWASGLAGMMTARADAAVDDRFVDVHYTRLVSDPLGTLAGVYESLGLELSPDTEAAMAGWLADNHRTRHGVHSYSLADCGLSVNEIDGAFGDYLHRFEVALEAEREDGNRH